jgi:rhodanese-related sulfurtransferase
MRCSKIVILVVLTCLFSVALVGCGEKVGTAPDGNEHEIEKAAIAIADEVGQLRYTAIDAEQMKNWIDLGEIMTVVDVRPEEDYLKGHLPNAVNAPIDREEEPTTEQIQALLELLPSNLESYVVIYDEYTSMNGSHRAAIFAADAGYTNVFRFIGGTIAWEAAGNSLTKK